MKLVFSVRDPVERTVSCYLQAKENTLKKEPEKYWPGLEEAFTDEEGEVVITQPFTSNSLHLWW